jgi:phage-related protein
MKPLFWMGSSRKDLRRFPAEVQDEMGYALRDAQFGGRRLNAEVMKGFGGAGVVEVVQDFDGDTYRAAYTVRFEDAVYVLHAFQKKSRRGVATPQRDIKLNRSRLRDAEAHHRQWRPGR